MIISSLIFEFSKEVMLSISSFNGGPIKELVNLTCDSIFKLFRDSSRHNNIDLEESISVPSRSKIIFFNFFMKVEGLYNSIIK